MNKLNNAKAKWSQTTLTMKFILVCYVLLLVTGLTGYLVPRLTMLVPATAFLMVLLIIPVIRVPFYKDRTKR